MESIPRLQQNSTMAHSVKDFRKELLHPGKGEVPSFLKNSKAVLHFRTLRLQQDGSLEEGDVLDDTRKMVTGPFELLMGREFKLGAWEEMVKTMRIGEVARFRCPFKTVMEYPRISKALRDLAKKSAGKEVHDHHHCGLAAMQGMGYPDLDQVVTDRCPLAFEFELLRVEQPGQYKKDSWAMTENEKTAAVPALREEGNALYKAGDFQKAAEKYFEAIAYLEELSIREKPQSDPWNSIEEKKVPLLLNYAQCKLLMEDYADAIRHTTTVLDFDSNNVKALYRRAKAHAACWNTEEAKSDFARVVELDPSLSKTVEKELRTLTERVREKDMDERERLKGKLF